MPMRVEPTIPPTTKAGKAPYTLQPLEAANNPDALLRMPILCALTGMGRSTIYEKIANGTFPAPAVKLGARCTRWRASDVHEWLHSPR